MAEIRLRRFFTLPRREQLLLVLALLALAGVRVALRCLPLDRVQGGLAALAGRFGRFLPQPPPPPTRIAEAIRLAARYLPGSTCLPQALAAHFLLSLYGHAARFHIGVARREDGRFEAHAWVADDSGVLVGDLPDLGRYVLLSSVDREGYVGIRGAFQAER